MQCKANTYHQIAFGNKHVSIWYKFRERRFRGRESILPVPSLASTFRWIGCAWVHGAWCVVHGVCRRKMGDVPSEPLSSPPSKFTLRENGRFNGRSAPICGYAGPAHAAAYRVGKFIVYGTRLRSPQPWRHYAASRLHGRLGVSIAEATIKTA